MASSLKSVCESLWLSTQADGYPLQDWVADRREAGDSWRAVANQLRDRTEGAIDLPAQTLINWFPDDREPADVA